MLTGGVLLLRNKYYIVIYRGKDFLPTTVAAALAERQQLAKQVQDVEEKVRVQDVEEKLRNGVVDAVPSSEEGGQALAGTLAEFYEAQARWGREITAEERQKMIEEDSMAKNVRRVKRIEHKLAIVSLLLLLWKFNFLLVMTHSVGMILKIRNGKTFSICKKVILLIVVGSCIWKSSKTFIMRELLRISVVSAILKGWLIINIYRLVTFLNS